MATRIDVRENEAFESGWFWASLAIIAIMAMSVLAAFSGILGGGPLAKAKAEVPHRPIEIDYERFVRTQTPSRLDVTIRQDIGSTPAFVHLDSAFLASRDIKDMLPHPIATRVEADGITYVFPLGDAHRGKVSFWLSPNTAGQARGTIAVDGDAVPVPQLIYP